MPCFGIAQLPVAIPLDPLSLAMQCCDPSVSSTRPAGVLAPGPVAPPVTRTLSGSPTFGRDVEVMIDVVLGANTKAKLSASTAKQKVAAAHETEVSADPSEST